MTGGPGPLTGLRVLDLSRVLTGPHCTGMLADMGADVIKVEPPEGDLTRFSFPKVGGISTYFTQQNCGKRNVSLDLRDHRATELVARLAEHADVLVENFRPGIMDRWGLGWEALHSRNPRLVYASITGYGHTGPWTGRRAFAPVVQAETGYTWASAPGHPASPQPVTPWNDPMSHGDLYTGLECLAGLLAALYQRERTGQGQWVEVSMAGTLLSVNEHVHWYLWPDPPGPTDEVPSFGAGDYPLLATAEGHAVVVAGHPASKGVFERFCRVMGRDDLVADPRLATVGGRLEHLDEIIDALRAWVAAHHDLEVLEDAFAAQGLALGVVRTVPEIAATDWARDRDAIVAVDDRVGGTVRVPNSPWRFSHAAAGIRGVAAYRGEHNREVLTEVLGLGEAELDALEADGVLSARVPRTAGAPGGAGAAGAPGTAGAPGAPGRASLPPS